MVDWSGSSTQASSEVFVFIRAFLLMSRSRRSQPPTTYRWISHRSVWIDADFLHRRHVYDHSIVAGRPFAVPPASDCCRQAVTAGEFHRSLNVGCSGAPYDHRWMTIHGPVPDAARRLVAGLTRQNYAALQARTELLYCGRIETQSLCAEATARAQDSE
jgi:hypothetical protein